jgi:hypothetical protein
MKASSPMIGSGSLDVTLQSFEITLSQPAGTSIAGRGLPPRDGSRFGERMSFGVPVNCGFGSSILSCTFSWASAETTSPAATTAAIMIPACFIVCPPLLLLCAD